MTSWAGLRVLGLAASLFVVVAQSPAAAADSRISELPDANPQVQSGGSSEDLVAAKLATIAASKGALGIYFDFEGGEFVVVLPRTEPTTFQLGDVADLGLRVRVEFRDITESAIRQIADDLVTQQFDALATKTTYGSYFDPKSGKVVIESSASSTIFSYFESTYPGEVEYRRAPGGLQSRVNDGAPHWGGAWINTPLGGCTSGYTVKNASGTKFMLTAGHCASQGATITGGTGLNWGVVVNKAPTPTDDLELIGNSTYAGSIYSGDATGTMQNVKGAADPVVDSTSYCVSGRTSAETCGHHAVSLTGTFCAPELGGCDNGMAIFRDGTLTQDGDSGAPWYTYPAGGGVTIRASHTGLFGSDMYAERWLAAKNVFGVTIVTSP